MASFVENFRINGRQKGFQKVDPIAEKRWEGANLSGFEKQINAGEVAHSPEKQRKEFETLRLMDSFYFDIADSFFKKMRDSYGSIENALAVPADKTVKEAEDFITEEVKNKEIYRSKLPNGETFLHNFRKYGYNKDLLSEWDTRSMTWTPTRKSLEYFPSIKNPTYTPTQNNEKML